MRRILCPFLAFAVVVAFDAARAIEVNPSKNTVPSSTWDTGGNRFTIFNGDPKRIQRANAVEPQSFDSKVDVSPNPISIKTAKLVGPNPSLKISFFVHNHAKKTYTLSFPTAQRWDFRISDATGKILYVYSENCDFEQKVGSSMVNRDDKLSYVETVDFNDLNAPLEPGTYKVEAIMANYPEMKAETQLVVQP